MRAAMSGMMRASSSLCTLGSTERMDLMDLLVERMFQRKLRQRTRQPSARLPTADSANATKQKLVAAQ
jgi:hypothetical protein